MIRIKHLGIKYDNISPLKDINLTINKGDVVSIIGPSGTGKSTLLRCINLLERPTSGEIIYNNENILAKKYDVYSYRKKIGMVFQSFNLFNHLTVIENVMKPQMDLLKRSKQEAYKNAEKLLRQVGLLEKKFSYPDELSGGQKQRIAIARTLAMDPELILFDEPTSALDPSLALEVLEVIANIAKSGTSMIIVTHEMEFAKEISTRVVYLDQGIVYEEGSSNDIFLHPKKDRTKQFIFHIQTWNYDIESIAYDYAGFNQSLRNFLYNHRVESRQFYIVQQLCDEAINEILIKCLDINNFHIHVAIELIRAKKEIAIHFNYTGAMLKAYKKLHRKNKLPDLIISKFAKSTSKSKYLSDFTLTIKQ